MKILAHKTGIDVFLSFMKMLLGTKRHSINESLNQDASLILNKMQVPNLNMYRYRR
jgi:hypothetical protein